MPFYDSAEQLYRCMQALFARIRQENTGAGESVQSLRLITQIRVTQPAAVITSNGRRHPIQTVYGHTALRPDLVVEMSGDTLHRILLDELPLKKAVASGKVKVRGPAWKTYGLADLFHKSQAVYPLVLQEMNLRGN